MKDMLRAFRVMALIVGTATAVLVFVWRFTFGSILFGGPRTNASFWRRGDSMLPDIPRASWYHFLPAALRGALRVSILAVTVGILWVIEPRLVLTPSLHVSYSVPAWLWWMFALTVTGAVAGGILHASRVIRRRKHFRNVVNPLRKALAYRLSAPERSTSWLDVPLRYASNPDHAVVIKLPQGFDRDAVGASVERAALDRLRIAEPRVTWNNYGANPTLVIAARPAPPTRVTLADILPAIESAPITDLVLGLGCSDKIVTVSTALDSPHIALSAPSNAGKSVAAGLILSQQCSKGATAVICDIKAESHTWAFDLPNIEVVTDVERIHAAIVAVWEEIQRRQQFVVSAARSGGTRPNFPRLWIVLEELNVTRRTLKEYWDRYREEDADRAKVVPKSSPALIALGNVAFAGRSVGVHAILVAQRLTAAATGDNTGAVRENMGIRYLIKPRISTWAMLADGAPLPSFVRGVKGRAHVVVDGHSEEVQGAYLTDVEMRELALSGKVTDLRDSLPSLLSSPGVSHPLTRSAPCPDTTEWTEDSGSPATRDVVTEPLFVTVDVALAEGAITGNAGTIRKQLQRDRERGNAPLSRRRGKGWEYDRVSLVQWAEARCSSTTTAGAPLDSAKAS